MVERPNIDLPEILVLFLRYTPDDLYHVLLDLSQPILYSAINKFYLEGYEKDDLIQEGRVIMTKAVSEYEFESSLTFLEYYQMMLMNHLHKLLRKQEAQRRRANKNAYSLEELIENYGIHIQGNAAAETFPEDAALVKEAYVEYTNDLSDFERLVYKEFLTGKTPDEIIEVLNFNKAQIQDAIQRCKQKLSKRLQ